MSDRVLTFTSEVRKAVRSIVSTLMKDGFIDNYTEQPYDEPNQKYVIEVSFNEGDDRVLEITLDIEPDP